MVWILSDELANTRRTKANMARDEGKVKLFYRVCVYNTACAVIEVSRVGLVV